MTFDRIRALGEWGYNSTIEPGEIEDIDENLSNALDGKNGGTYALEDELEIGGVSLRISAPLTIEGVAQFENTLTVTADGELNVVGPGAFNGGLTIGTAGNFTCGRPAIFNTTIVGHGLATLDHGLTLEGVGTLDCEIAAIFTGSVQVTGAAQKLEVSGSADLNVKNTGTLTCEGAASFSGTVGISGATTLADATLSATKTLTNRGVIKNTAAGQIVQRVVELGDAGSTTTLGVDSVDVIFLPQTVGATRTLTITDTGAQVGSVIRICRRIDLGALSGDVQININGATGTYTTGPGGHIWLMFMYVASDGWVPIDMRP